MRTRTFYFNNTTRFRASTKKMRLRIKRRTKIRTLRFDDFVYFLERFVGRWKVGGGRNGEEVAQRCTLLQNTKTKFVCKLAVEIKISPRVVFFAVFASRHVQYRCVRPRRHRTRVRRKRKINKSRKRTNE